jgi:hypothetical protein
MLLEKLKYEILESNIFLWKNVISKENCNTIIKLIEENSDWQNAKVGNKENTKEDMSYRSNKVDHLTSRFGINSNIYWCHNTIGYGIKKVIEETIKEYSYNKDNLIYFVSQDEGFQVLKYEKGQFYKTHLDYGKENSRVLSVLLYLNEDYEGGETYFPRQNIKIKGEQGDVLLFPSNYCYPHSAEEILDGIKYSVVTWFK